MPQKTQLSALRRYGLRAGEAEAIRIQLNSRSRLGREWLNARTSFAVRVVLFIAVGRGSGPGLFVQQRHLKGRLLSPLTAGTLMY
jgi:hypothetical protein